MKKTNTPTVSNSVFFSLLSVLLFIKSYSFYSHISLDKFPPAFAAATLAIFVAAHLVVSLLSKKAADIVSFSVYALFSVVMAVDAVYFSYVSKLPSVAMLGMANQLGDITDTIQKLVKPRDIFLLCDLPLWVLYAVDRDILRRKTERFTRFRALLSKEVRISASSAAQGAVIAICSLFVVFFPDFEPEYMINELFCYHAVDIVSTLSESGGNYTVNKSLYTSPDYSDSEYYGIARGRNVFIIQVEAMQNFVIGAEYNGQEIMPNLNSLIAGDSFYFKNYYYQIGGGNTSDAEFGVNNSLFAPESDAAYVKYEKNTYHGLPYLLKDNGYSGAHVFHGYTGSFWNRENAYVYQGFDDYTSLEDFREIDPFPMGISDKEMFRQSMEHIKTYKEPFYAFYITLSSHYPYAIPLKDREIVLDEEDEGTLFGLYIQVMNYTDRAIGTFIEQLKEAGLYENSVFVFYGDHYALSNTDESNASRFKKMLGRSYTVYDVFNVPLIMHIPGSGVCETLEVAGGHLDVLPTLLCLLGITNDKAVMFGQNLLAAENGFVCEQTHLGIGSFISDEVFFSKPHNNIKSRYDAYARGTMERLDPDLFKKQSDEAEKRIKDCAKLLADNDVLLD